MVNLTHTCHLEALPQAKAFLGKKHHLPRNTFGLYLSTGGLQQYMFHVYSENVGSDESSTGKTGVFLGLRWNWTWKCHPTHPRDHRPTPPALAVEVIARWATLIGHRREQESHGRCAHNLGWWWSLGWWNMYIRKKNITSIPANPWWKWMEMFFNGSKWRGVTSVPLILWLLADSGRRRLWGVNIQYIPMLRYGCGASNSE